MEKSDLSWLKNRQVLNHRETKNAVLNGTFDYSNSPDRYYMVKKHKCASSTFARTIEAYEKWRGIRVERPIFGTLGGCYPAPFDDRCRVNGADLFWRLVQIKFTRDVFTRSLVRKDSMTRCSRVLAPISPNHRRSAVFCLIWQYVEHE